MFSAVEPTAEFLNFVQILCWIVLPVLLGTASITSYLHYRRKKKEEEETDDVELRFMGASPEQVGYTNGNGEYVVFDHSRLIQEYKNKLSFNHARYTALKKDFVAMKTQYTALARFTQTRLSTSKSKTMEQVQEKMPAHIQTEVNKLVKDHEAEKKELFARLEQVNRSYESLEQENRSLQSQLDITNATDEEKRALIKRWTDENGMLRDKIAEQEYLKDILNEKNAEIGFLQAQLEQRIKEQYRADREKENAVSEMKQVRNENMEASAHTDSLKNALLLKQDEVDKLQVIICGKEEQLAEKEQQLNGKIDQLAYLENTFNEMKQQNELLNAELADKRDLLTALQQQIEEEKSVAQAMDQKLQSQKQAMRRLYKELSVLMENEREMLPVISMKAAYGDQENEGVVVQ